METKIQGMETWITVNTKNDGLEMIDLICDVTHRRDDMSQVMLDIVL